MLALLVAGCAGCVCHSQTAYFADGYHGGIYGHYPDWTTGFMVDTLKKHPQWKINLEIEPETWDRARTVDPAAYNELKALVEDQSANGRIEFVNPTYAQPYLWNISGESIIRQFQYGMRKVRAHFPGATFTTYASEEPCFTSALPGLLKSFGYSQAVLKNPDTCWGGYTRAFGGELVNWVGPDGTAIPTVPRYAIEALQPHSTWQTIAWNNSAAYLEAARRADIVHPVGMCLQDTGWKNGPWLGDGNNPGRSSEYVTWRGYFRNIAMAHPSEDWRFSQEDVQVSLVWGSQVLQRLAQQVRAAENSVVMAGKLAALAHFQTGAVWPEDALDGAWKSLMLAQHHDCWIVPYNGRPGNTWADKVAVWTGETRTASEGIMHQATTAMSVSPGNQNSIDVRIFNTQGTRCNEPVSVSWPADWVGSNARIMDAGNHEVASQVLSVAGSKPKEILFHAEVPALGCNTYRIQRTNASFFAGAMAVVQDNGSCQLETDLYRIVLDPAKGGVITSLVAKTLGNKEFVDRSNPMGFSEIRGFFHDGGGLLSSAGSPGTIRILENGPVRARLEVAGKVGIHPFTQTISVAQGQRRIDFSLRLDWVGNPGVGASHRQNDRWQQEDNQHAFYDDRAKLLAVFPSNLKGQKVFKDAPFDVTESRLTNTFFTTWDSIKNNIILHWMDVEENSGDYGLALLSDHTTSYVHGADHPPGLVLQYSGIGLWGRHYNITGPTSVHYALVPHVGRWDQAAVPTESARWNEPLVAVLSGPRSAPGNAGQSMMDLTGTGWEATALTVDGKSLLVRLFNAEGDALPKHLLLDGQVTTAQLVELNGEVRSRLESSRDASGKTAVTLAIPRFGVRTLRLDGVAVVSPEK